MLIYRDLKKLHLVHFSKNEYLMYLFTSLMVILGSIIFLICVRWFLNKIEVLLKEDDRRINHV